MLPSPFGVRPRDVVRVAGQAVAADLRQQRRAAPPAPLLALEDEHRRSPRRGSGPAGSGRTAGRRSGLIAPSRTKPQYSSFSMISTAPADRDVGAARCGSDRPRTRSRSSPPRRLPATSAPCRARRTLAPRESEAGSSHSVAALGVLIAQLSFVDPGLLELTEHVGLAHRRADHHRRPVSPARASAGSARVFDGHARRRDR